jgi:tryptophan halogenase
MKIAIIGGGTAGWLTGLFFNRISDHEITIIDSSRVGILGAGEASTPNLQGLLLSLGISERDFLETTGATIKVANDFINWSPYGGKFSHDFRPPGMSELKAKIIHGYHFDARRCAEYFKGIGTKRGIKYLDVNVTDFTQNEKGDITHIHTEENIDIEADFVIDCSGFARLGAGKLYKSKWISYSDHLIANRAFAYFLPQDQNLTSSSVTHTQSIAMDYGWMWQAPLQHRWGCGYVYNDTYITLEDAKKEAEKYLGREIEIVKTFKFDAGSYEKTWNNNCVSLGLASGFLEPLEGTSLMTLIFSIYSLAGIGLESRERSDDYNEQVNVMNRECMLFVRNHYNCGRTDTKYWRDINESELPIDLSNIIKNLPNMSSDKDLFKILNYENTENALPVFGIHNYNIVNLGHITKQHKTLM